MNCQMTGERLRQENLMYRGTGGVSRHNAGRGFRPAFCDLESGRVELSCFEAGVPAPIHLLCGLPEEWVESRDIDGQVVGVKQSVIAGFLREGRFYTREEASRAVGG